MQIIHNHAFLRDSYSTRSNLFENYTVILQFKFEKIPDENINIPGGHN